MDNTVKKKLPDANLETAANLFAEECRALGLDQFICLALRSLGPEVTSADVDVFTLGSFDGAGIANLIAGVLSRLPAETVGKVISTLVTHPALQGLGFHTTTTRKPNPNPPEFMN